MFLHQTMNSMMAGTTWALFAIIASVSSTALALGNCSIHVVGYLNYF